MKTCANCDDIGSVNKVVFALLAVSILLIGIYPNALLNVVHASAGHLVELTMQSRYG